MRQMPARGVAPASQV